MMDDMGDHQPCAARWNGALGSNHGQVLALIGTDGLVLGGMSVPVRGRYLQVAVGDWLVRDSTGALFVLSDEAARILHAERGPAGPVDEHYLSTACHHQLHTRCARTCKFCAAACRCECTHTEQDEEPLVRILSAALIDGDVRAARLEPQLRLPERVTAVLEALRAIEPEDGR